MNKVIVIGCPGSGKSTFSRALHELTNLPFSWCKIQYEKLHDASKTEIKDIYPIPTKLTIINKSTPPTSIMNEEAKNEAIKRFEEWQKQQNKQ